MTDFLIKKQSPLHGFGIFTTRKIVKGEEFYHIPLDLIENKWHENHAHIGNGRYVSDAKILNWVNHSCVPNAILDISRTQPALIALSDIQPDEEITCDYDLTEVAGKIFRCNCQKKKCKGYTGRKQRILS